MLDTRVKKTLCTICTHKEVCSHKKDFLDIIEAIENASITRNAPDGKITSMKLIDYDFISGISVGCKYYQQTKTCPRI